MSLPDALVRVIFEQVEKAIDAHHFAWMTADPDNKGPQGGKTFIYVCSCKNGYADRKELAEHQKRAILGIPEVTGGET